MTAHAADFTKGANNKIGMVAGCEFARLAIFANTKKSIKSY